MKKAPWVYISAAAAGGSVLFARCVGVDAGPAADGSDIQKIMALGTSSSSASPGEILIPNMTGEGSFDATPHARREAMINAQGSAVLLYYSDEPLTPRILGLTTSVVTLTLVAP